MIAAAAAIKAGNRGEQYRELAIVSSKRPVRSTQARWVRQNHCADGSQWRLLWRAGS